MGYRPHATQWLWDQQGAGDYVATSREMCSEHQDLFSGKAPSTVYNKMHHELISVAECVQLLIFKATGG